MMNWRPKAEEFRTKYKLGEKIGEGSFSEVFKVKARKNNTIFACKVFPKSNLKSKTEETRFQREIDSMAYLHYDNIVSLHDLFWDDTNFYLIMDYCEGGELFNYIVRQQKLPEPLAALIFKQIVGAVAFCHSYGVAHRDLKPENILISEFPTVKITDFGLCGYVNEKALMKTFCGSPSYCSPECLCKIQYDGRLSDIWSLGIILYAMVTGEHPWNVSNSSMMLRQIIKAKYVLPSFLTPECKDLIQSLIVVQPSKRLPIEKILTHPWMNFSEWALVKPPPSLDYALASLRLQAPTTIEKISSSSSRSSHRSDHGIISPFDDNEISSDIMSLEAPISLADLHAPSLPNLRVLSSSFERITRRGKSTRYQNPLSTRTQKIVQPTISVPTMSVIKELD